MEKSMISLDNGLNVHTVQEAWPIIVARNLWDAIVSLMDDDIVKTVNWRHNVSTNRNFLIHYCRYHRRAHGTIFTIG